MSRKRLAAIAWTALIVAACSIPGNELPRVRVDYVDKSAHFVLFFVFAWLWMRAGTGTSVLRLGTMLVAGLLLAGGTEVYQGLLPINRSPDVLDAVANAVGLIAGIAAFVAAEHVRSNEPGDFAS